jgi:hypothetical protein
MTPTPVRRAGWESIARAFFYGMFDYALKLPFPEGLLMDWLNI